MELNFVTYFGVGRRRLTLFRSSGPEVVCKKGVFKNFAKLTGKQLCRSFF